MLSQETKFYINYIILIKLAVYFPFKRLHISRHHPGGALRVPAPEAAAQPHGLHRPAARGAREDLPEDALPRRGHARATGNVHEPPRGPRAGRLIIY